MSALIGILLAAALFGLAAFLKARGDCGGSCDGCPIGTCARAPHDAGEHR
jgi:hypothetical protein